jgi:hypothetical protein
MLFVPPLFMVVNPLPANISSQATTTQTLNVTVSCTMTAKLWGGAGGKSNPFDRTKDGGGGGYATAAFTLAPGDVVTYAAGGSTSDRTGGTSGSGNGNGGLGGTADGYGGGGRTELYINGVLRLVAGGGGAGCRDGSGGGGGGSSGNAGSTNSGSTSGYGGTQSAAGGGGSPSSGVPGSPGSGGTGGAGGNQGGGAGGGGYWGGGGGCGDGLVGGAPTSGGGGGSGYDSTGSGTLTAATDWQAANNTDPDYVFPAASSGQPGLVVLNFAA